MVAARFGGGTLGRTEPHTRLRNLLLKARKPTAGAPGPSLPACCMLHLREVCKPTGRSTLSCTPLEPASHAFTAVPMCCSIPTVQR